MTLYLSIQGCYGIVPVVSIESLMFLSCLLCSDSVKGCYCRVILYMYGLERSTLSFGCYWLGYFVLTEDTLSIESKYLFGIRVICICLAWYCFDVVSSVIGRSCCLLAVLSELGMCGIVLTLNILSLLV